MLARGAPPGAVVGSGVGEAGLGVGGGVAVASGVAVGSGVAVAGVVAVGSGVGDAGGAGGVGVGSASSSLTLWSPEMLLIALFLESLAIWLPFSSAAKPLTRPS